MSLFRKILTLGGNETYNRAIGLYNQASYEEAIREFEKVAKGRLGGRLYPQLAQFFGGQAHRNLGLVEMHGGRYRNAITRFEKASAMTPENLEIHAYLGVCYNNEGHYQEAAREFGQVVQEEPADSHGFLRLALACCNAGRHDEAVSRIKQAIAMEPRHADLHYLLGVILNHQKEYQRATDAFTEAIRLNPKYLEAYTKLGYTYAFMGELSKAKETFHQALSFSPDDPRLKEGLLLLEEGKSGEEAFLKKAREEFSRAMMIDPNPADTFMALRKTQKDIGFYNTLVQIYETALKEHPQYADFHYGLGHALHQLGRLEEAQAQYEKALAINADYLQAKEAFERLRQERRGNG